MSDAPQTSGKWTRYLPETWGIRQSIEKSKYRWCARESFMWGIATGCAMGLHRWRMGSPRIWVVRSFFLTTSIVSFPSYYFCVKRRQHQEKMIELMMRVNQFESMENMPEPTPVDKDHPFMEKVGGDDSNESESSSSSSSSSSSKKIMNDLEFTGRLEERKEWQEQLPGAQDARDVFQKKNKRNP